MMMKERKTAYAALCVILSAVGSLYFSSWCQFIYTLLSRCSPHTKTRKMGALVIVIRNFQCMKNIIMTMLTMYQNSQKKNKNTNMHILLY
jgi:hypothetical protein